MSQPRQQPGAAAGTPALNCAHRDAEHLRSVGDRVAEHVDEDDRDLLIVRQLPERGVSHERRTELG